MKVITGDLIQLALAGEFDVIGHGCSCFCTQKKGLAKQMANTFSTNDPMYYHYEGSVHYRDINKLGLIEYNHYFIKGKSITFIGEPLSDINGKFTDDYDRILTVCNMYTQFNYGTSKRHLDYDALILCLRKMAFMFNSLNSRIGLPLIGGGLAGGDSDKIKEIMEREMAGTDFTLVEYDKN